MRAYLEAHPELARAAVCGMKDERPQPVDTTAVTIGIDDGAAVFESFSVAPLARQ